jgi:hypothetical protein
MITLMGHRDDVVAEPEREQQLGRVRHQGHNPHPWAS